MSKIKVGFLPLYIKLYDDSGTNRKPYEDHMNMMIGMLEAEGLEVVAAPVCRINPEFVEEVAKLKEQDITALITYHLAYHPSLESIEVLKNVGVPIIVLDSTPDYSLVDRAGYYNGISPNHGIHGVQDMTCMLRANDVEYYVCAGHALHSEVIAEVAGYCRAAAAAKAYKTARVGSVGGSFTGMGDFKVTDEDYKAKIGAEVFYMDKDVTAEYLPKVTEEEIDAEIAYDAKNYTVEVENMEAYRAATKAGLALRKWTEDMKLTAVTVNFLTLDICGLPKMPFIECSKAMVRGLGYGGEGDTLTAGLVGALRSVYPETSFVEMFCPDWKNDVILLNHMGEANLNLAQWKPVVYDKPFNFNSCGNTVAASMCYRPGEAVYVNLAPYKGGFSMIVTPVEMLGCGLEYGAYRKAVQGWLKPNQPIGSFLKKYSEFGGTHHSCMVYGAKVDEIVAFGKMMGFEVHVI